MNNRNLSTDKKKNETRKINSSMTHRKPLNKIPNHVKSTLKYKQEESP